MPKKEEEILNDGKVGKPGYNLADALFYGFSTAILKAKEPDPEETRNFEEVLIANLQSDADLRNHIKTNRMVAKKVARWLPNRTHQRIIAEFIPQI